MEEKHSAISSDIVESYLVRGSGLEDYPEDVVLDVKESDSERMVSDLAEDLPKMTSYLGEPNFENTAPLLSEKKFENLCLEENDTGTDAPGLIKTPLEKTPLGPVGNDFENSDDSSVNEFENSTSCVSGQTENAKLCTTVPNIKEFFNEKSIFVTGVTGFLGKVLLEKLLRTCKGIEKIFVLIRTKCGKDAKDRWRMLLNNKIFEPIRSECPEALSKVVPISGDISVPGLELDVNNLKLILEKTSVVFHAAANVRFDENTRKTLSDNLLGTKHILDLCYEMKQLKAFVHVSTVHSFCNWNETTGYIYPEKIYPRELIAMMEGMSDEALEKAVKRVLNGRPYVYHFSKAMAEIYLANRRKHVPLAMIRPSILTGAWREPFPGWIDTYNWPSSLIAGWGKGIIKTVFAPPGVIADWVPVDMVVNTMIAAARSIAFRPSRQLIVNCTSSTINPLTWREMERMCHPLTIKYPSIRAFRYPGGSFKSSRLVHQASMIFYHLLPAYLVDYICLLHSPNSMVSLYRRLHRTLVHLEYFTDNNLVFRSANMLRLWETLGMEDKADFPFHVAYLSWEEYMETYVLGIRRFLWCEKDETLPEARTKLKRTYYRWTTLEVMPVIFGMWYLHKRTRTSSVVLSNLQALQNWIVPKLCIKKN